MEYFACECDKSLFISLMTQCKNEMQCLCKYCFIIDREGKNAIFEIYEESSKLSMKLDWKLSGSRNQSVGGYMLPTVIK